MRYVRKMVLMENNFYSTDHIVSGVNFGLVNATIDVDHFTGDFRSVRVGQSRYEVPKADLDWSLGDPSESALAWLIAPLGPLVDGELLEVESLEIARQEKLAAVAKASAVVIAQARQAADDMIRRASEANDLDTLDTIAPDQLAQGSTNDG